MVYAATYDRLRRFQDAALEVLRRGVATLDSGQAAMLAENAALRGDMGEALGRYQQFKHAELFDPAIASGDAERVALARRMKAECIGAGETFRGHMARWSGDSIATDWANYRPAARLTANRLRRHIAAERDGLTRLIAMADSDGGGA